MTGAAVVYLLCNMQHMKRASRRHQCVVGGFAGWSKPRLKPLHLDIGCLYDAYAVYRLYPAFLG